VEDGVVGYNCGTFRVIKAGAQLCWAASQESTLVTIMNMNRVLNTPEEINTH